MVFLLPSRKANTHYIILEGKSLQQLAHHTLILCDYVPGILPGFVGTEVKHMHCKSRFFHPSHSKGSILMPSNTESWRKGGESWLFSVCKQCTQVRNAVTADGPSVSTTFLWLLFFLLCFPCFSNICHFFWSFWDSFTWAKGLFLFLLFYFPWVQFFFSYLALGLLRFIFSRF